MAKANPVQLAPQAPKREAKEPVIEYLGEEAKKVKFEINPNAVRYVVHPSGKILEYLE